MTGTRRDILYLSGTRADFGLMRHTLRAIAAHPRLRLGIAACGMHLEAAFGHTVDEIEAAGLPLVARIATDVASRDRAGMARAVAQTLLGVTAQLERERPDLLLLLGDRGEMLAGAIAALHLGVPSVHLHGGERSGTVDEPMRHAISKLATWHFAATEQSRERLIAMGEEPSRVFVVGAPGLDDIAATVAPPRTSTLQALGVDGTRPYVLVLFHPVVQQAEQAAAQTAALLQGLLDAGAGRDFDVAWLAPNADAGSAAVLQQLEQLPGQWRRHAHLPRDLYLGALRDAAALLGNSSSGIIEAASFGTPVVNVGLRQHLRERNAGTVDVDVRADAIASALRAALTHSRIDAHNVYGDGDSARRIAARLAELPLDDALLRKTNRY
jgi:GDP/UDP-N,N'-diacetylbacillosamine 2-epimerase (hydrolysing)